MEAPRATCGDDDAMTGGNGDEMPLDRTAGSGSKHEPSQTPCRKFCYLPYVGKAHLARRTRSFLLGLPIEIRDTIYFLLLRPDLDKFAEHAGWRNASGSTKVLQLSKQIYYEARAVMDCYVNTLVLLGDGQRLFRKMLSQGKPNMFHMSSMPSACFIPRTYCELQFLRMRKVTISIRYPVKTTGFGSAGATFDLRSVRRLAALKQEVSELTTAVEKSKSLVELHFEFQTDAVTYDQEEKGVCHSGPTPITNVENAEMIQMLSPVVDAARRNRVVLTAEEDKEFVLKLPGEKHAWAFRDEEYRDPLARYINETRKLGDARTDSAPPVTGRTIRTPNGSYDLVVYPHLPYELQPECRKCYRSFKTDAELRGHLAGTPSHRIRFRKQQYNNISPLASTSPARHKCLVCGVGYDSRDSRDRHCERFGHFRDNVVQGMAPRFKRHNRWYTCTFQSENDAILVPLPAAGIRPENISSWELEG